MTGWREPDWFTTPDRLVPDQWTYDARRGPCGTPGTVSGRVSRRSDLHAIDKILVNTIVLFDQQAVHIGIKPRKAGIERAGELQVLDD